jgi:uncharacterized RDD family membrane protein YckC
MDYSGFWRRFLAFILDFIFLGLVCAILVIPFFFLAPLTVIVSFFYYPIFNASTLKGTPGKYIMGLTVTKLDGSRLDFKTAIIRHLMCFVSSSFFFIGYMLFFFTEKKQTLHDYVSDTIVLREELESLNVFTVWIDEMKELFNINSTPSNMTINNSKPVTYSGPRQSLEDLFELHKKGILTDIEYNAKKEEYLRRL